MQVSNKSPMTGIIVGIAAIIIVGGLILGGLKMMSGGSNSDAEIQRNKYQAIFLTNGQVYFGKLSGTGQDYIKLTDIYYLQVQQNVQPTEGDEESQVSLAKLGTELHGPDDVMHISREQVLFWENLKDDSKVVKAITENQKK